MNTMYKTNKLAKPSGYLMWFMLLLGALTVAGCGSSENDGNREMRDPILGTPVVTSVPTVTATSPLATTPIVTGVAVNSSISATFSRDMLAASITTSSFTLACPVGTPITGTVTYVDASRAATLTPASNLPADTICTATITTTAQDTVGTPLASAFVWQFRTASAPDTTRPRVTSTVPSTDATNVAINAAVSATFTEEMAPATITGSSFTLTGPGTTAVAGSVSYAVGSRTATFTPTNNLPSFTLMTATVTMAATDLAGNELAGNQAPLPAASDYVWTFTTGAVPDTVAPRITLTNPADLQTNVAIDANVHASFSEPMNPLTITNVTFTLQETGPPLGALIDGLVTYNVATNIASFDPQDDLQPGTSYTATVTSAATDLAGNNLVAGLVPNPWTFTTAAAVVPIQPLAIDLGAAESFGIAAGAGMTTTGITVVNGDIALSPTGTCTDATGIPANCAVNPHVGDGNGLTVNGSIYFAADAFDNGVTAALVKDDLTTAWNQGQAFVPDSATVAGDQLSSVTPYLPGIRQNANLNFAAGGTAIFDAQGDANAVWIFQVDTDFTDSGTLLLPTEIILQNGAQARNVWFVVGRDAVIGDGSIWNGNVLAGRDFTVNIGATMVGRALAGAAPGGAGFISLLDGATITVP